MDYCDDTECQYYNPSGCIAVDRHHSTDKFCTTGRRKQRDDSKMLMAHFNSGCGSTNRGFKSNHGRLVK